MLLQSLLLGKIIDAKNYLRNSMKREKYQEYLEFVQLLDSDYAEIFFVFIHYKFYADYLGNFTTLSLEIIL